MKFAIFGNTYQPKKSLHALRLFELLKKQGAEICMCREFYQFLTADLKMEVPVDALLEGNDFTADMAVSYTHLVVIYDIFGYRTDVL